MVDYFFHASFVWRVPAIEKSQRINEQIRISPIRVIGADGSQLGVIPTDQAMALARDQDLDLVEVAPSDRPPVCRIMDFGKFKYQQNKKHAKSHSHQSKLKELRVRPSTGVHDIDTKLNQARGFLKHKDKVVFSVIFRGRENAHIEEGFRVANHICTQLEEFGKVESPPQQQSKRIIFVIIPK